MYLRGWCYATDPTYVAEHPDMWRSPAMAGAAEEALRVAGVGADDCAYLDLYSCFGSSLMFARDVLGIGDADTRSLTVTGGLPYHGGPASGYMTHSIATMADVLRSDPGSFGIVSGVGMMMTKHVYGVYSTEPGPVAPPEQARVQASVDARGAVPLVATYEGEAECVAYTIIHGHDPAPEWGLAVCDLGDGTRTYAKLFDADLLVGAEKEELVGRRLRLTPTPMKNDAGMDVTANIAVLA